MPKIIAIDISGSNVSDEVGFKRTMRYAIANANPAAKVYFYGMAIHGPYDLDKAEQALESALSSRGMNNPIANDYGWGSIEKNVYDLAYSQHAHVVMVTDNVPLMMQEAAMTAIDLVVNRDTVYSTEIQKPFRSIKVV